MDKRATIFTFSWIGFTILLLTVSQCTSWPRAGRISDLSHFEGQKADSDLICESRVVRKKTPLPAQIGFTSQLPITAYSAVSSKYSRHGFTISIQTGALNKNTIGLVILGPRTLPYDVLGNIPSLSHSGGMKLDSDRLLFIRTIQQGSQLPYRFDGSVCTSLTVVSAYTAVAIGGSMQGFTLRLTGGGFLTCDLILTLDVPGANTLPYDVKVSIYVPNN